MKDGKIFYGWYVVIGCLLITCTLVPPIMALSSKFLMQVTEELQISRSAFTLANTILQGLGIFLSPFVSAKLAKGDMKKIQTISIVLFAVSYASYSLAQNVIHLYISSLFIGFFYLNATLIPITMMITNWFAKKRGLAMSIAMAGIGIGGAVFSIAAAFVMAHFFPFMSTAVWIGLGLTVVVFGTWGDLTESLLKRTLGIKDSGNILPGHGGMLDRFDSTLIAVPASVVYLYIVSLI